MSPWVTRPKDKPPHLRLTGAPYDPLPWLQPALHERPNQRVLRSEAFCLTVILECFQIRFPTRTRGSKMFMDRHVGLISRRGRAAAEFLLCFIGRSDVSARSKSFLPLQLQPIRALRLRSSIDVAFVYCFRLLLLHLTLVRDQRRSRCSGFCNVCV